MRSLSSGQSKSPSATHPSTMCLLSLSPFPFDFEAESAAPAHSRLESPTFGHSLILFVYTRCERPTSASRRTLGPWTRKERWFFYLFRAVKTLVMQVPGGRGQASFVCRNGSHDAFVRQEYRLLSTHEVNAGTTPTRHETPGHIKHKNTGTFVARTTLEPLNLCATPSVGGAG